MNPVSFRSATVSCILFTKSLYNNRCIRHWGEKKKVITLTFFCHFPARGYTSAYINPSLAYGLTFHCPGFTLAQYALVYWLGPLTGRYQ